MGSKVNFHSSVPDDCLEYHTLLSKAFSFFPSKPYLALDTLFQAFEYYLEPEALCLAIKILNSWPGYAQFLAYYAHLLYPDLFQLIPKPEGVTQCFDLPLAVNRLFFPEARPRVSLCMIVRDEINTLPLCLESLAELVDEKIICDTGSLDGTLSYLQNEPGVTCLTFSWQDDYALARNFSLAQATGDWVLILDADELLPEKTRDYLMHFFAFPPLGWQLMTLQVEHLQAHSASHFSRAARIFRRSEQIQFTGPVHELPIRIKAPVYMQPVQLPMRLIHSGNQSEVKLVRKNRLRLQLLSKALEQKTTPYLRYQYAMLQLKLFPESNFLKLEQQLMSALNETIVYQGKMPPFLGWLPAPLDYLIHCLLDLFCRTQNYVKVLELYEGYGKYWGFSVDYYLLARSAQSLQKLSLAKDSFVRCLDQRLSLLGHEEFLSTKVFRGLLELALLENKPIWTLFIVRRLLEYAPSGDTVSFEAGLLALESKLEQDLSLERGTWLDRLNFAIQSQLSKHNLFRVAELVLLALYDSWDKTILCDALRVMHVFKQPALAFQVARLGRSLYPQESLFHLHQSDLLKQTLDHPELNLASLWGNVLALPLKKPKISVCMIVRNAEDTLLASLRSVALLADEYIIADTGSEDQTLSLLADWEREYPVKLLRLAWQDDFSWARNQLLEAASGDWIFVLDADEVLCSESLAPLKEICAYQPTGLQIFALRCESQHEQSELLQQDWVPRLFRRHPKIRYWGSVHERPGHATKAERLPVQALTQISLRHTGYLPSAVKKHRKWERNGLLADNLEISGYANPYFLFHQGYVLLEQGSETSIQEGVALLLKAKSETLYYQSRPPVAGWFAAPLGKVRLILFRHWFRQGDLTEIMRVYPGESSEMNDPEYHYYYAQALLKSGVYLKAKDIFKYCLTLQAGSLPRAGFDSWQSLLGLINIALIEKEWRIGLDLWQELLSLNCPLPVQKIYAEWWQRMAQDKDFNKRASSS